MGVAQLSRWHCGAWIETNQAYCETEKASKLAPFAGRED